ncbi:hypothetical protein GJ744_001630 [Endocarpon pusillum]|uniref:H-type lectin domain-containing protein n=1 Tax=Endocarpon pusillum TaxID=364733 RepID=A0A8H7DZD4_9EURO|nr:hypothetical protein GJ744_001630 [Endocarpon pusillum]
MIRLHAFLSFILLASTTSGAWYNPYPPSRPVTRYVPVKAEYPLGTDDVETYGGSAPTCGQATEQVTEPGINDVVTTKNVTWSPLLRQVTLGLSALDVDKANNIRVRARTTNLKPDGASIQVDTWGNTKLYWADSNYVAWGECASTLEHGTLHTYEEKVWSKYVKFSEYYDAPPTVVVSFYHLDLKPTGNAWRVRAYANDITTTGFTVGAESWASSEAYAVGVSWIAVPANSTTFRAGSYSTSALHDWRNPSQLHSKALAFSSPLQHNPSVFTGLNYIDMANDRNLRIKLTQDSISGAGFTWHIDSWFDSKIMVASASYLAW